MAERGYPLGYSPEETQELIQRAQMHDLSLRRLFEDAGIGPGMRVLDLGSGPGDVALTAAQFVGEAGSVMGVDRNPASLETARERARAAGYHNVSFVVGNLDQDLALDGEFDAVVGRFVLMYVADPVATLRSVLRHLRPGGVVAFQETNLTVPSPHQKAFPPSPLYTRMQEWISQAFVKTGNETVMVYKLYQAYLDVGLPEPEMRVHARLSNRSRAAQILADVLRVLRPVLLQHGITTEAELDASIEQLRVEFVTERKVALLNLLVDAWARKP